MRELRKWIDEGALPRGEALPAERHLAERMNVSRKTLRWALAALEEEGVLKNRGSRTRLVAAGQTHSAAGLFGAAVLVICKHEMPLAGHEQVGWSDHIPQGALLGVRQSGRSGLTLNAAKIDSWQTAVSQSRPAGVIVSCFEGDRQIVQPLLEELASAKVPIVVFGDEPMDQGFDRVVPDHASGAYALTRWLIEGGRRRILNFWSGPQQFNWIAERRRGYEQAMREAGLGPLATEWLPLRATAPQSREEFELHARFAAGHLGPHLASPTPPDAIMCLSDGSVTETAAACKLFGRRPHHDIAIVGYDHYWAESPERAWETTRPLATVDKQNFQMGLEMSQLLQERIDGRLPPEPQRRVAAAKLVPLPDASTEERV